MKKTTLLVCISLFINGVVTDESVSVSVMEEDTVTLHTGIFIQREDVIDWRFGDQQNLIAKLNREANTRELYDDTERFRGRLIMNDQTGDLTITNITTERTGAYHLDITGQKFTQKTFNVSCVFGAEVKSVSVMEGDSVTLHPDITDIQKYDVILWRFQHEHSPLAELNRKAGNFPKYVSDGKFRGKLQLNVQTGSLTIANFVRDHSGLYEVDISSSGSHTIHQSYTLTVSDERDLLSVMEGESVTLHTHTKLQRDDLIEWTFGPQESPIVRINRAANKISIYDDVLDGRFRDRLQVNDQTGDLTIMNTKTKDSGLYELKMSSRRRSIHRRFIVTVSGDGLPSYSIAVIFFCVLAFAACVGIVVCICYQKFPPAKTPEVKEGNSIILHTDFTNIKDVDEIKWRLGRQKTLIAEVKRCSNIIYDDVLNGTFRERLRLRDESGSLIINDARTTDAGLYQLKITSGEKTSRKRFKLTVTDTHKQIKVNEGNSYTLKNDTDKLTIKLIEWRFKETLIAEINPANKIFCTYDGDNGLFNDKLELNHQTGDLEIKNITQEQTGVYTLKTINNNTDEKTSYRRFTVSLKESVPENQHLLQGDA